MNIQKGQSVLDVGCGVGGPAREIATFTGANVTGLNNNDYQISRAEAYCARRNLSQQCNFVKGDFMQMPFEDATFDMVYAIEATVHAPKLEGVYGEIFRVLKPGGTLWRALKNVGFEITFNEDLAENDGTPPWYYPLEGNVIECAESVGLDYDFPNDSRWSLHYTICHRTTRTSKTRTPWHTTGRRSTGDCRGCTRRRRTTEIVHNQCTSQYAKSLNR
ncbi:hypothetical protein MRB53_040837 [Persea americana]|nr:hypothetical protein MRB53_040837 [Persea americana]